MLAPPGGVSLAMATTPAQRSRIAKRLAARANGRDETEFVLRVVQPSLVGTIDGTVSTLALRKVPASRHLSSGSDGTRTRDLRRDRPAL